MAREFNGSNSTLNFGSSVPDLTASWTISMWIRRDGTGRVDPLWSRWTNSSTNRQLYVYFTTGGSDNKIQVDVPFVAAIVTSTSTITNTAWHHIVVRRDGTTWTIWIDGTQDASATSSATQEAGGSVELGTSSAASAFLDGHLGHTAAWDVAISDADIVLLSKGANPAGIDAGNLVFNAPLCGDVSPEPELVSSNNGTESQTGTSYPRLFYAAAADEVIAEPADWAEIESGGTASVAGSDYTVNTGSGEAAAFLSAPKGQFEFTCQVKLVSGSGALIMAGPNHGTLPTTAWSSPYAYLTDDGAGVANVVYINTASSVITSSNITVPVNTFYDVSIRRELGQQVWTVNGTAITIDDDSLNADLSRGQSRVVLGDPQTSFDAFNATYRSPAFTAAGSFTTPYLDLKDPSTSGTLVSPLLDTGHAGQNAALGQSLAGMRRDMKAPAGGFEVYTLDAGNPSYTGLFAWDCYWAMLLMRQVGADTSARNIVTEFLDFQEADGRVPQFILSTGIFDPEATEKYTHPYYCQMAYLMCYDGDTTWLDATSESAAGVSISYYEALKEHIAYWEAEKLSARGLFIITESREGWDGFIAANPSQTDPGPLNAYEWIGHNAMMYREYLALAGIAAEKGETADHTTYLNKANALKTLIQSDLWDATDEWFYAWDISGAAFHERFQADAVYALFCGVASTAQAAAIRDRLMDPAHFLRPGGITSLDITDAAYPGSVIFNTNWNGPVWLPVQYMAAWGLKRYGYDDDAAIVAALAYQVTQANRANTSTLGSNGEWQNPETGLYLAGESNFTGWHGMGAGIIKQLSSGWNPTEISDTTTVADETWDAGGGGGTAARYLTLLGVG